MMASKTLRRPRIKDLHSHLVCGICMGYFVDATTINECLHTFCRSCIVKYLETSNFCPMCDVQIHKSRPLQNLRPDGMLQDLVYKVVPGFYASEMQKRRDHYASVKEKGILTPEADNLMTPELKGESAGSQHYSPDESISLSLEYYIDNDNDNNEEEEEEVEEAEVEEEDSELDGKQNSTRRYYKCPAAVCIRILKKLLRSKYGLHENEKVDIIYKKECLPEHFTLIDVGYIFSCKKKRLLKFYFRFYTKPYTPNLDCTKSVKRTITDSTNGEVKRPRVNSVESGSTVADASRKNERQTSQPLATSTHSAPVPVEEPEKRPAPAKEKSPSPRLPSPKRSVEKKDDKSKRVGSQEDSGIPAKKPKVDSPKQPPPQTDAATASAPKSLSQPPKPIQPGTKPPSQTSLLLKQQIAQQREQKQQQQQQQQMLKMQRQMMNQKQAKMAMTKVDNKSPVPSKQLPQLQKLPQKQQTKNNGRPVMPQPSTCSIGTQSLPIVSKPQEPAPKQSMPAPKPTPQVIKSPPMPMQRPPIAGVPTSVSVSTSTSVNRPVTASPSSGPSQNNLSMNPEQRRINNDMIEKNKMRPVVVIERHGNGRPKVKQVPSPLKLHQQMSREFNKISAEMTPNTPKAPTPSTTLTVAPTDSATKVKIVKTPTQSPEGNDQSKKTDNSKKDASSGAAETPKGKGPDGGVLDLSGKSTRKSDSPNSSVGSPSPPAPKAPTPPVEQRKMTIPAPPKPSPAQQQPQQMQQHQQKQPMVNNKPKPSSKAHDIMKIAQSCLNEKLPFFRQSQQFTNANAQVSPPPNPQNIGLSKINSFSYQSLMNDALMRSNALVQLQKHHHQQQQQQMQQKQAMNQQQKMRTQNAQGPKLAAGPRTNMSQGPNPKAQNPNSAAIRIPHPAKTSPPRHGDNSAMLLPSRVQARIHDLFPNPQTNKPGPNQAVRHIPNPSLLGRQNTMRMTHMDMTPSPASVRKDEITITPARNPGASPMSSLRKIETLTQNLQRNICEGGKLSVPPSMSVGVVATEASQ